MPIPTAQHEDIGVIAADEDVDFLRRQVPTSRNVRGGPLVDWVLGGLNYQVEHRLFPSMPRPSLRRAQRLVRAYCTAQDVAYAETPFFGSYRTVLRHLHGLGAPRRGAARHLTPSAGQG